MLPLHRHRPKVANATKSASAEVPRDPAAKRIKDGAEAATAVAKAILFFGAIAIVGAVVAITVWRDRHARHVEVTIDPEAERVLRAMGPQIDLRQTFIDILNDRISKVKAIFSLQLAQLVDPSDAPDVSFKPFGLDASTGQISKIVQELTGAEPPARVRIELTCRKARCDEAGAVDLVLLVTLTDHSGSERLVIPLEERSSALRRTLRNAMSRSADRMLERVEPMITAVYYLNARVQRLFRDDAWRDMQRAMSSATKLRDRDGEASCISNLVVGGSLTMRGDIDNGLRVEKRAGRARDYACQVHSATNIVFFRYYGIFDEDVRQRDETLRQVTEAMAGLASPPLFGVDPLVADRIPAARIAVADMAFLNGPNMEATRRALVLNRRIAEGASPDIENHILDSLGGIVKTLPPRPTQQAAHGSFRQLVDFERFAIPQQAVVSRYKVSVAIGRAIDDYLPTAEKPRLLYSVQGRIATELTAVVIDALAMGADAQRTLLTAMGRDVAAPGFDPGAALRQEATVHRLEARVAFENALATEGSPYIGETDLSLTTAMGDAALAQGDADSARAAYAHVIESFLASDEPVDQLLALADALAPLAALDRATGVCASDASRSGSDGFAPGRIGFTPAEWCALSSGTLQTVDSARPALKNYLASLIRPSVVECKSFPQERSAQTASLWLRCLRAHGPSNPVVFYGVSKDLSGAALAAAMGDTLQVTSPSVD